MIDPPPEPAAAHASPRAGRKAAGRGRRRLLRALLAAAGIAAPLCAIEVALRVLDPLHYGELIEREDFGTAILAQEGGVLRLKPNTRTSYFGHDVVISSLGLRNPETPIAKPDGVYRILVVGDSVAFGWGIAEQDSFPRVLERMLAERPAPPGRDRVEVINAGRPGWGIVEYYQFLKDDGMGFDPDLVLVTFINNDIPMEAFLPADRPATHRTRLPDWARRSYLARALRDAVDKWRGNEVRADYDYFVDLEVIPAAAQFCCKVFGAMRECCGKVPMAIIDTVGVQGGGRLESVVECVEAMGIPRIEAYLARPTYREEFAISPADPHPNAAGHRLVAGWVLAWIEREILK